MTINGKKLKRINIIDYWYKVISISLKQGTALSSTVTCRMTALTANVNIADLC